MTGEAEVIEESETEFEAEFAQLADKRDGLEPVDDKADDAIADGELPAEEVAAADEAAQAEADPFEGWPQSAIDAYKDQEKKAADLEHRIKSDDGRVGAFQRKINNLEHQVAQIQKAPGQPSTADITSAMGSDESWTEFSKEYPEVASAIDGRLTGFSQQVNNTLAPVVEKQAETAKNEAVDVVAQTYPKWQDAVKTTEFSEFMDLQPPGIQALADSEDTADASTLIGMYDTYRVAQGDETLRSDPKPEIEDGSVDNKADEIAARRQRQLEDGVTIPSKNARIDPNADAGSEFENAFAAFAARKEANRA